MVTLAVLLNLRKDSHDRWPALVPSFGLEICSHFVQESGSDPASPLGRGYENVARIAGVDGRQIRKDDAANTNVERSHRSDDHVPAIAGSARGAEIREQTGFGLSLHVLE